MTTKWILGLAGLLLIAIIGYSIYSSGAQSPTPDTLGTTSAPHETTNPGAVNPEATSTTPSTTATSTTNGSSGQSNGSTGGYTLAQVAAHGSQTSCWTAVNGKVYDVTKWIAQHPGGSQAILSLCGKDGSSAFNGQHGTQRRPNSELAGFLIGSLTQ